MTAFTCRTCGAAFPIPPATLAKFRGWKPQFCREHSPSKKGRSGGRKGARTGGAAGAAPAESLTPGEVLKRHTTGPQEGVFTDGSSVPNPGPGGWGVVWVRGGQIVAERSGHHPATTNNRMELTALIEALKLLPEDAETTVWTDSRLCVDTIETWAAGWERNGWKRKTGEIKNVELVRELYALRRARPGCRLAWIQAHAGHRWNEYADSLASAWMRKS